MIKVIKSLRLVIISAVVITLGLLVFGALSIPDEFSTIDTEKKSMLFIHLTLLSMMPH